MVAVRAAICPVRCLRVEEGKAVFSKAENCMKCGHCFASCPNGSITIFSHNVRETAIDDLDMKNMSTAIQMRRSIRNFKQ